MDLERFLDHPPSPAVLRALRADAAMNPPSGAEDAVWSRVTAALAASGTVIAASATLGTTSHLAGSASASVAKAAPLGFAALSKLFGMSFGVGLIVSGAGALVMHSAEWRENHPANAGITAPAAHASEGTDARTRARTDSNGTAERDAHDVTSDDAQARDALDAVGVRAPAVGTAPRAEPTGAAPPGHEAASGAQQASAHVEPPAPPSAGPSEESRIVLAARDALRAGEPRRALAELERAELAGLPGLTQERLALEIDAWLAAGMLDIAKDRAAVFLQRYPNSPHAARFRSLR
jgi:hypothetical protein